MKAVKDLSALVAAVARPSTQGARLVIAIDGLDGSGKSYLARALHKAIGGALISLDDFLEHDQGNYVPSLRLPDIQAAVAESSDPIIIEGVCLLTVLEQIDLTPTCHVYVKRLRSDGIWMDEEECDPQEPVDQLLDRLGQEAMPFAALLAPSKNQQGSSGLAGAREEIIRYHAAVRPAARADVVFLRVADD